MRPRAASVQRRAGASAARRPTGVGLSGVGSGLICPSSLWPALVRSKSLGRESEHICRRSPERQYVTQRPAAGVSLTFINPAGGPGWLASRLLAGRLLLPPCAPRAWPRARPSPATVPWRGLRSWRAPRQASPTAPRGAPIRRGSTCHREHRPDRRLRRDALTQIFNTRTPALPGVGSSTPRALVLANDRTSWSPISPRCCRGRHLSATHAVQAICARTPNAASWNAASPMKQS
jgi:hypothetical protein